MPDYGQHEPYAALQRHFYPEQAEWWEFRDAEKLLETYDLNEVPTLLQQAWEASQRGLHAVGWIAFEAAAAFDPAFETHAPEPGLPLLRFTLFRQGQRGLSPRAPQDFRISQLKPLWSEADFCQKVAQIKEAIAAGETYQVNLTYPLEGQFSGDPWSLFRSLRLGQAARHQAYLEEEDQILLSASPELFFRWEKGRIHCRPMKGTAKPGREQRLSDSPKDRAENVMIVDMIRNDLGRLASPGSVRVEDLFRIEAYPSLLQMTSGIRAEAPCSPADWMKVLFPCASITGAPKAKTMEWIRKLEQGPRGVYTGAIGGFFPEGPSEFNVAIRSARLRRSDKHLRYSVGCGIVWDSEAETEYKESRLKAKVLTQLANEFELLETLAWTPRGGCPLWPRHRKRIVDSAQALGFSLQAKQLDAAYEESWQGKREALRIRMLCDVDGALRVETAPLPAPIPCLTFRIDLEASPSRHPQLAHKSTRRSLYHEARERCPDADETLLWNERGELMEFCIGSLVLIREGEALTPAKHCGLLPGIMRAEELVRGRIREAVLSKADLETAEEIWLLNAVRGWQRMRWLR